MKLRWNDPDSLRVLAEEAVVSARIDSGMSRNRLAHELLVHQTELEMQNEALRDAQAELQASQLRYKDLFEDAPVGYLVVDGSSRIEVANSAAGELFGASPKALVGVRLSKFLLPVDAIAFERYRRELLRSGTRLTTEFTINDARGRTREVRLDGLCTDAEKGGFRVALTDVTMENNLARKLDHSERLGAVGRNASLVAHDLNNLLYIVLGYADAALGRLEPEDAAHAPVTRLGEIIRRCAEATEQLTTFSRAEMSEPVIVDLNAAIAGMEDVIRALLGNEISLELNLAASDAAVRLDAVHIEQIVLNVVRNARQAMPHGGTFLIETASVELGGPADPERVVSTRAVRWSMSDTGLGMPESTREHAFEPFFTTKPPGKGTGLGLSMVKTTVERASGVVTLESELGRGTSLVVHLPRASGSTRAATDGEAFEGASFSTAMVVDDDPATRAQIATRLRSAGCDVVQAGSSGEALELLGRVAERLAVLLVDDRLHGALVGEFIRAAHAISPGLKVVVAPLHGDDGPSRRSPRGEPPSDEPLEEAIQMVLSAATRSSAK
jgi:two-component system cell cycle sensor histidine kinase/response regulator CckA